jgi:hypothetical protein
MHLCVRPIMFWLRDCLIVQIYCNEMSEERDMAERERERERERDGRE